MSRTQESQEQRRALESSSSTCRSLTVNLATWRCHSAGSSESSSAPCGSSGSQVLLPTLAHCSWSVPPGGRLRLGLGPRLLQLFILLTLVWTAEWFSARRALSPWQLLSLLMHPGVCGAHLAGTTVPCVQAWSTCS